MPALLAVSEYDEQGNVWKETDALGVVTSYDYNIEGQLEFMDIAGDGNDIHVKYYDLGDGSIEYW